MAAIAVEERLHEFAGSTRPVRIVRIDGQVVSTTFPLEFDASWCQGYSGICEECYFSTSGQLLSCGYPDIEVRRHGDLVFWYGVDEGEHVGRSQVTSDSVLSFSVAEYEAAFGGSGQSLPPFTTAEIDDWVRCTTRPPPRGSCLYTDPELPFDRSGEGLLRAVEWVVARGGFSIAATPRRSIDVLLGWENDEPGGGEWRIAIGLDQESPSMRIRDPTAFPLWITSQGITTCLVPAVEPLDR